MSLPMSEIERIFLRMSTSYGAAWDRALGTAPVVGVKAVWAHELQNFDKHMEMVAWALENLPERPPNVFEFRNLCRRAPEPETPRLPEPKPDPERVEAELAKLGNVAQKLAYVDKKDWARRILSRFEAGAEIKPLVLRFAKEALRC